MTKGVERGATTAVGGAMVSPYLIAPRQGGDASFEAVLARVEGERGRIEAELLDRGAVLLRGYRVGSAEQFAALVDVLSGGAALGDYAGGASPRSSLGGSGSAGSGWPVYNSTDYPPHIMLPLHNELSYTDAYPARVYFFCLVAPEAGGETTLGDSRRILSALPAAVRGRFEEKGVRYIRTLISDPGSPYSWQVAFGSGDPAAVEAKCAAIGAEAAWLPGGVLRVVQARPATAVHPVTGEDVWFNQADGFHPSALDPVSYAELMALCGSEDRFRLNVSHGDGTAIAREDLAAIRAVLAAETVPHRWQEGDVLMLDNMLTAHGRAPFSGPRKIAVAMT